MRRIIILLAALVVAVLIAGTSYFWAEQRGKQELAAAISQLRISLGPDGALTYQSARAAPFARSATLTGVAARDSQGDRVTASIVSVTAHGPILTHVSARDVGIDPHGGMGIITVRSLEAWGIAKLPRAANSPPGPPHPSRFTADDVSVTLPDADEARAALASFITQGGTLVVDLHPTDPLPFATLLAAAHDLALAATTLGLSVENHPSASPTAH